MDKVSAIRIKHTDGTYSDEIPIGVLAGNVKWDNTHTLTDVLGSVDVGNDGSIQEQINNKADENDIQNYVTNQMATYITDWLQDNIDPTGQTVAIDSSLMVEGAAADAKAAGQIVQVSATQPTKNNNRIWVGTLEEQYEVPTMDEFNQVETDIAELKADLLQLETTVNYRSEQIDITPQALLYTKAYITSGGAITASSAWDARIMFADEITKFKSINVSAYQASSGRKQVAFYSSEKPSDDNYISGIAFISGVNPSVITVDKADIPNGTKSVLFTNLVSGGNMSIVGKLDTNDISDAGNAVSKITSALTNDEKAKFDNRFNYICYSDNGASGGIAINTEEMYVWAGRHDFVGIKGDVRLSSDGQIVMCHDAGFTLDENGHVVAYDSTNNIKINTLTYAECVALTYPNGEHVCGIDALVRTCKIYGKVAYVTVRDGQIWDIAPKLFESLDKYAMRDRTIINSFTLETLKIMRKFDSDIMLSWVQGANHVVTTGDVDEAVKLGNALVCGYDYGNGSPTGIENQSQEIIDYAKQKGVRFYEAIVTNDTSLNQLYDKGVVGAQIEYLPSCLTY